MDVQGMNLLIDEFERRTDEVERLMQQLLREMEQAPVGERSAYKERFIELTRLQREIGEKLLMTMDHSASTTKN